MCSGYIDLDDTDCPHSVTLFVHFVIFLLYVEFAKEIEGNNGVYVYDNT